MTILTDFQTHLIRLREQSPELTAYLVDVDWLKRGVPHNDVHPQITLEQWWTVSASSKESFKEVITLFVSLWHSADDDERADEADQHSQLLMSMLHQTDTPEGLWIEAMGRQALGDPNATKARVRMQFRVARS